jgi:hypothetical protein
LEKQATFMCIIKKPTYHHFEGHSRRKKKGLPREDGKLIRLLSSPFIPLFKLCQVCWNPKLF